MVSESDHSNPYNNQPSQPIPSPSRSITSDVIPIRAMDTPRRTYRAWSQASAKNRHKRRHIAPMEPAITEDILEEKMMEILGKALSSWLSNLFKDAIVQVMPWCHLRKLWERQVSFQFLWLMLWRLIQSPFLLVQFLPKIHLLSNI